MANMGPSGTVVKLPTTALHNITSVFSIPIFVEPGG